MKTCENTLVLGGCKSGKSRYAQALAERLSNDKRVYLATCVPLDEEMNDRVRKHKEDRDGTWITVEEPMEIPECIRKEGENAGVILLDCVTLWLTNLFLTDMGLKALHDKVDDLIKMLDACSCPVVIVSNEVGWGIVPENGTARSFRDLAGLVNQQIAGSVDRVVMTVAGLPMTLKGNPLL
jgi:adenosylcobinamide kinase / adenosylcobinamide-phosphate guanylyltransferase